MVHCVPCAKFHRASHTPYVDPKWNCQDLECSIRLFGPPHNVLRFIYIQAALKRHRLGLDINRYIKALSHERYLALNFLTGTPSYALSEARIVSGELLVRVQEWNFHPAEFLRRGIPSDAYFPSFVDYFGCYHWGHGSANGQLEKLLTDLSLDWESVNRSNHYGGLWQCRFCDTEFQVNIIPFLDLASKRPKNPRLHDRYIATVKTAWANYGDGGLDPNGKYRRHFMREWRPPLTGLRAPS